MASATLSPRHRHMFKNIHHQHVICSAFLSMREKNQYCDVVITAENRHFNCHKMVLSATCPYFRVMFSSLFEENVSNTVEIKEIKADIMDILIVYLYKGEIDITITNAQDIIFAADMFQLDALKTACSQFLQSQLRTYNCLGMWNVARQLQEAELEEQAWNLARSSFTRVSDQEEFLDLSDEDIRFLLTDTKIKVTSEEIVCKGLLKWLEHKPERKKHLKLILKAIHITELNPAYIKTFLMKHNLLRHSEWTILLQTVLDHLTMNMPCPSDLASLPVRDYTDSVTGVLLLGGKVNRPMVRTHECTFVTIEQSSDKTQCIVHQEIVAQLPTTHKYTAACSQGNTVYVSGMGSSLREVWKFDNAKHWTECEKMRFSRNGHTLISGFTDSLFAIGGSEVASDVSHNISSIEEYSVHQNSWKVAGQLSLPVCYAGAMFYSGKIFVMGGFMKNRAACHKIQMFDTQTGVCVKLETRLPRPMAYCKGIVVREKLILVDKEVSLVFNAKELLPESVESDVLKNEPRGSDPEPLDLSTNDTDLESERSTTDGDTSVNCSMDNDDTDLALQIEPENICDSCKSDDQSIQPVLTQIYQSNTASTPPKNMYTVKSGCGVELAAAECLGNKLMVFGGRRDERDLDSNRVLTKAIRAANVEDFMSTTSDPKWDTVGRLSHPMIVFMTAKLRMNKFTSKRQNDQN